MPSWRGRTTVYCQAQLRLCAVLTPVLFIVSSLLRHSHISDSKGGKYVCIRTAVIPRKLLQIQTIGGLTNQKLGIISGIILANEFSMDISIPPAILDGTTERSRLIHKSTNQHSLRELFDVETLERFLSMSQIHLSKRNQTQGCDCVLKDLESCISHCEHQVIDAGSPFLRVSSSLVAKQKDVFRNALEHLLPSPEIMTYARLIKRRIGGDFNLLHLRVEKDWKAHCLTWHNQSECFGNLNSIGELASQYCFSPEIITILCFDKRQTDEAMLELALENIKAMNLKVVYTEEYLPGFQRLPREKRACIEYQLAIDANCFMGNSISTFSALAAIERNILHRKSSSFYNDGPIPLNKFFPVYGDSN